MQDKNQAKQLNDQWDNAVEQAQQETARSESLGEMLTTSAGLHIKSGIESGGLWGTTSCTCEQSCTCGATCS